MQEKPLNYGIWCLQPCWEVIGKDTHINLDLICHILVGRPSTKDKSGIMETTTKPASTCQYENYWSNEWIIHVSWWSTLLPKMQKGFGCVDTVDQVFALSPIIILLHYCLVPLDCDWENTETKQFKYRFSISSTAVCINWTLSTDLGYV